MASAFETLLNIITIFVLLFVSAVVSYIALSGNPVVSIGLKPSTPPDTGKETDAKEQEDKTQPPQTEQKPMSKKEKALTITDAVAEQTYRAIYTATNPYALVADTASMLLGLMGAHKAAAKLGKGIDAVISRTPLGALFGALFDPKLSAKCKARQILSFGFSRCGGILDRKGKPDPNRVYTKEEETPIQVERFSYKTLVYVPETKSIRLADTVERFSVKEKPVETAKPPTPPVSTDHSTTVVGSERFKY
eukprot:jgi/Mesvir1/26707/Mv20484-RA.1